MPPSQKISSVFEGGSAELSEHDQDLRFELSVKPNNEEMSDLDLTRFRGHLIAGAVGLSERRPSATFTTPIPARVPS